MRNVCHNGAGIQGGNRLLQHLERLQSTANLALRRLDDEEGLSTAELLGNVALAIVALIAIWTVISDEGQALISEMFGRARAGG